jgi:hypothetical protein
MQDQVDLLLANFDQLPPEVANQLQEMMNNPGED